MDKLTNKEIQRGRKNGKRKEDRKNGRKKQERNLVGKIVT